MWNTSPISDSNWHSASLNKNCLRSASTCALQMADAFPRSCCTRPIRTRSHNPLYGSDICTLQCSNTTGKGKRSRHISFCSSDKSNAKSSNCRLCSVNSRSLDNAKPAHAHKTSAEPMIFNKKSPLVHISFYEQGRNIMIHVSVFLSCFDAVFTSFFVYLHSPSKRFIILRSSIILLNRVP